MDLSEFILKEFRVFHSAIIYFYVATLMFFECIMQGNNFFLVIMRHIHLHQKSLDLMIINFLAGWEAILSIWMIFITDPVRIALLSFTIGQTYHRNKVCGTRIEHYYYYYYYYFAFGCFALIYFCFKPKQTIYYCIPFIQKKEAISQS